MHRHTHGNLLALVLAESEDQRSQLPILRFPATATRSLPVLRSGLDSLAGVARANIAALLQTVYG